MLTIAICEDDPAARSRLDRQLQQALAGDEYSLSCYDTGQGLLAALSGEPADIVLMDIELPDGQGIDIARQLAEKYPACQIIFVSGHLEYATEVYGVPHVWFVLKSQAEDKLPLALDQARANLLRRRSQTVSIEFNNTVRVLSQADILYLERQGRVTNICCRQEAYHTYESLDSLLSRLSAAEFCRCHNSYAVRMPAVVRYQRTAFQLSNGAEIPISRSYWDKARTAFFRFAQSGLREG